MPRSSFVWSSNPYGVGDYIAISDACAAFEQYLRDNDYEAAVEVCPWAEGEYVGAEDAYDLLADFLGEHPEYDVARDELAIHACEIGQVSNAFADAPDERDDLDDLGESEQR
jgi:hypothetical protein